MTDFDDPAPRLLCPASLFGLGLGMARYDVRDGVVRFEATLIYRRTKNLRAVQLLLGHTKLEITVPYLSIEVDDALEIVE